MASLTVSSPLLTSPTLVSSHCSPRLISKRTARFSNTNSTIQLFSYSLQFQPLTSFHDSLRTSKTAPISATMATGIVKEVLPPALTSTSDPPPVFDGTTRLYISYTCPYAQRVWITRNCKGLQDLIKLVPIDLQDRPAWYKEKVYPPNKVPALEHNNEVKGESLDLIQYIDSNFDGPLLFPDDPAKKDLAEELIAYIDSFNKALVSLFKGEANEAGAVLDFIETSLTKFDDGPLFLGQFSLVDIAYAPFIDRFQPALLDVRDYDITAGRPNLAAWIEEMNKNEAYNQTRRDPKEYVESYKRRFLAQL
ncbi:protein IN2-1 homolog B isoform X1 [Ricinus communis]|uniref:glutathione transferase n=1 Tax=Ricinus communis TaxID=3988 RepID=B9SGE5_RICCO|nr:protein IN2-1 homolog B isoform X1 [Ricinus communis]EEF37311.1 glutathione-s-transferase omega, putative [Ricinus communis]|eukprot:XP_002525064.1 protein IN2-1 homolog B [Ricinus communis]